MRCKPNNLFERVALPALGLAAICAFTSCAQGSQQPAVTDPVNPISQTSLQFAVGTANVAGVIGLNTVETFRQQSGPYIGASILTNAPTIVGPPQFVVPSQPDAGTDAGTARIRGSVVTNIASAPPITTFNPAVGPPGIAASYGFLPAQVTNPSTTPDLTPYALPFYAGANAALASSGKLEYVGGPPAFTPPGHSSTQDGTFPKGYSGYTLGFVDFQAVPVTGSYTLDVAVPTGVNANGQSSFSTKSATSSLKTRNALATWGTPPSFVPDGNGGGTITTNYSGTGVAEEFIEVVNTGVPNAGTNSGFVCQRSGAGPYYYTFQVQRGTATVTVPDSIGAAPPGSAQPHTFCTSVENGGVGDGYLVYGFAVDYPLAESAFPRSSGQVNPRIANASGNANITTSAASSGNAP